MDRTGAREGTVPVGAGLAALGGRGCDGGDEVYGCTVCCGGWRCGEDGAGGQANDRFGASGEATGEGAGRNVRGDDGVGTGGETCVGNCSGGIGEWKAAKHNAVISKGEAAGGGASCGGDCSGQLGGGTKGYGGGSAG